MQLYRLLASVVISVCLVSPGWAALPLFSSDGDKVPSLAPMLESVNPAVVNISTFTTRTVMQNPLLNDPFFRRFFNIPPGHNTPRQHRTQSAGSGVIIDAKEGWVVTNHHVIDGADEVMVGLEDGRTFKAKVVGSDPDVDIAVLQIDAKNLRALKLADSDELRVGDFVVAIGNPFGLNHTVTTGVVSALGRSGLGIEGYEDFIQTDASINPGNSGGALVNLKGELVGINTAILSRSGGSVGIGFAIPTNMAGASIEQIIEYGEVRRGRLGVVIQDLTPQLAEAFGLKQHQRGVVISEVLEDSEAAEAGLKPGDVVVSLEGKPVVSSSELRNAIGERRIGEQIKLTVLRDGKTRVVETKVGEPQEQQATSAQLNQFLEGAALQNYDEGPGVVVTDIAHGSPASGSGLRPGDVIVTANNEQVSNLDDLKAALEKSTDRLLLRVLRDNAALYIVIQ